MAKGGFRGPMGGGMNMNMIKQAQKMQQDMLKMQEELEVKQYEAAAGGGVVKAVVNGKHEVVSLTIDPEAVDPEDVEMLQDMVAIIKGGRLIRSGTMDEVKGDESLESVFLELEAE